MLFIVKFCLTKFIIRTNFMALLIYKYKIDGDNILSIS